MTVTIVSTAVNKDDMKAEIIAFLKARARQQRNLVGTTSRKSGKAVYIAQAQFVESLVTELEGIEVSD